MDNADKRSYVKQNGGVPAGLSQANSVVTTETKLLSVKVVEQVAAFILLMITMMAVSAPANAYCTAGGATSSYEWVDTLGINGNTVTTGDNGGYYLHPEHVLETADINLALTPGFSSYTYPEYWGVWVDWNQDDNFSESERVFSGQTVTDEMLSAAFTVPSDALIGPTRMRIVMSYGADPEPCGSFSYGEVEDVPLIVTVTGEPSAPPPVEYCTASGSDPFNEWIDAVEINGIPLISGSNGGYLMHEFGVALDTPNISLYLTPGYASFPAMENWAVWVDWNQDRVFDASEQMIIANGQDSLWVSFDVPADALPGETLMRIVMIPDPELMPCGNFLSGEVEDIHLSLPGSDSTFNYELSLGSDYTVYRNGALDAAVIWVVEKDGAIVGSVNGAYELSYRYWDLSEGSHYRVWLEESGQSAVSEPIEFTVGQTLNYQLWVDSDHRLMRSGSFGDPLMWVIEQDGMIVSELDASNGLEFTYFDNTNGSHFRVWLAMYGQRVSNAVEYLVGGNLNYELTLDQSYRVIRTGNLGEPLQWRVVKDGMLQDFYDASGDLQWIDYALSEGSVYEVTLTAKDAFQTQVSNTVMFMVGDLPVSHTLSFADGMLTRSGMIGELLTLVIEEQGRVVYEQDASNELQYYTYMNPGLQYRFWLEAFVDGGNQRVSNIVIPETGSEPQPEPDYTYVLGMDSDYSVYRNGALDANVTWVLEENGVIGLMKNGAYVLSEYFGDLPDGAHCRVWLEENGLPVSAAVEFTVGQTLNFQLTVDSEYHLTRSGLIGEPLSWIIEQDGNIVLEREAGYELDYTYIYNTAGSHFRVWLASYGKRVSNVVEYLVGGNLNYELTLDQSHRVVRTGNIGEPLLWRVEKNGILQGISDAGSELQWIDYEHSEGSTYSVTLVTADGSQTPVSNTLQYMVDDLPLTYTLSYADWALTRSGTTGGPNMYWVIEEGGRIVLEPYASNELQYYPTLIPGVQYRFWLKAFVGDGYQRVSNIVIQQADSSLPPPNTSYELSLGSDYTVYRNGALDAAVIWVVEKDGAIVESVNGAYGLSYRYGYLSEGSHFRIWLEEAGQTVSSAAEFTVGETLNYQLSVDSAYHLSRSGYIGDPLMWVIEQDGGIVLERDASYELDYTYIANTSGSHYRVWMTQFIDGTYKRVSNVIEYKVDGNLDYDLTLDGSHRVVRTGNTGEPLLWRVEKDGMLHGIYDASTELQWIDYEHSDGSTYAVTLVTNDALQMPVSNTVQYVVDDLPLTHSLSFTDGVLGRSGELGDSLTWVIEQDGGVVLERNAANELEYDPFMYIDKQYRFWLESLVDGGYQRVSNIIIQ